MASGGHPTVRLSPVIDTRLDIHHPSSSLKMRLSRGAGILRRLGTGEIARPLDVFLRTVVGLAQLGVAHGDENELSLSTCLIKSEEIIGFLRLRTEALCINERAVIPRPAEIDDRGVSLLHWSLLFLLGHLLLRLLGKERLLLYRGDALIDGILVSDGLLGEAFYGLLEFLLRGKEVKGTFLVMVVLLADLSETVFKPPDGGGKEEKG